MKFDLSMSNLKKFVMCDGYGPVENYDGPYRNLDTNDVVYIDEKSNRIIFAKDVYRKLKIN